MTTSFSLPHFGASPRVRTVRSLSAERNFLNIVIRQAKARGASLPERKNRNEEPPTLRPLAVLAFSSLPVPEANRSRPLRFMNSGAREGQSNAARGLATVRQKPELRRGLGSTEQMAHGPDRNAARPLIWKAREEVGAALLTSGFGCMTATGVHGRVTRRTRRLAAHRQTGCRDDTTRTKVFRGRIAPKSLSVTKARDTSLYTAVCLSTGLRISTHVGCVVPARLPSLPAVCSSRLTSKGVR